VRCTLAGPSRCCELLEQQSKFLKSWGKFSDEQVREYVSRQRQIKALILAMNREGNGDKSEAPHLGFIFSVFPATVLVADLSRIFSGRDRSGGKPCPSQPSQNELAS